MPSSSSSAAADALTFRLSPVCDQPSQLTETVVVSSRGRLRAKAGIEHGTTPVNAATLELIAEELRDPGASPRLRRALYEAAKLIPGVEYLGEVTDPAGRRGVAVGIAGSHSGDPVRYSMIFDPETSQVLATETTSRATLLRARVYLKARGSGSMTGNGGTWLSG